MDFFLSIKESKKNNQNVITQKRLVYINVCGLISWDVDCYFLIVMLFKALSSDLSPI